MQNAVNRLVLFFHQYVIFLDLCVLHPINRLKLNISGEWSWRGHGSHLLSGEQCIDTVEERFCV